MSRYLRRKGIYHENIEISDLIPATVNGVGEVGLKVSVEIGSAEVG